MTKKKNDDRLGKGRRSVALRGRPATDAAGQPYPFWGDPSRGADVVTDLVTVALEEIARRQIGVEFVRELGGRLVVSDHLTGLARTQGGSASIAALAFAPDVVAESTLPETLEAAPIYTVAYDLAGVFLRALRANHPGAALLLLAATITDARLNEQAQAPGNAPEPAPLRKRADRNRTDRNRA